MFYVAFFFLFSHIINKKAKMLSLIINNPKFLIKYKPNFKGFVYNKAFLIYKFIELD